MHNIGLIHAPGKAIPLLRRSKLSSAALRPVRASACPSATSKIRRRLTNLESAFVTQNESDDERIGWRRLRDHTGTQRRYAAGETHERDCGLAYLRYYRRTDSKSTQDLANPTAAENKRMRKLVEQLSKDGFVSKTGSSSPNQIQVSLTRAGQVHSNQHAQTTREQANGPTPTAR